MITMQQLADFSARQVEIGRGQWKARLSHRAILGLPNSLPENTCLGVRLPDPSHTYDESKQVVFIEGRLEEVKA